MTETEKYFEDRFQTMVGEPLEEIRKADLMIICVWMQDYADAKVKEFSSRQVVMSELNEPHYCINKTHPRISNDFTAMGEVTKQSATVDERVVNLEIQTYAPLPEQFFSELADLVSTHANPRTLSHEDIVGEGWEYGQLNNYSLVSEGLIWRLLYQDKDKAVNIYLGSQVAFSGTINSVNQLRTIMKMVGIKK